MTPEAIEGWRARARSNPLDFARWMFKARKGAKWELAPHHHLINAFLLRVYAGEIRRGIINIPPRYSKTESVVNFIAWAIGQYPDSEFIYTSYSSRLSTKASYDCREIVAHPEYQAVFPHVRLRDDSAAKDEWMTTAGGRLYAVGAGGTITGYGAGKMRPGFGGCIVVDDILKADDAGSDTMRGNANDWFATTLESRTNHPDTPIIVIAQRLHEDDLCGFLLRGGNGEEWEHLCLPARRKDGSPLWPFKHSAAALNRMEQASPYVFAGQYLQDPAPPSGGEIKPDMMPVVEAIPAGTAFCRGWDLGATAGGGDPTAGVKIGRCPDGRYIVADVVRGQWAPEDVRSAILSAAGSDGLECVVSYPQDPGQAGKNQAKEFAKMLSGYQIEATPETGDKLTRARPFASQVNVGNVLMLRAPWNDAYKAELRLFPNGRHDDQVDASARAFGRVSLNHDAWLEFMYSGAGEEDAQDKDDDEEY